MTMHDQPVPKTHGFAADRDGAVTEISGVDENPRTSRGELCVVCGNTFTGEIR